jgi:hypothetical protein
LAYQDAERGGDLGDVENELRIAIDALASLEEANRLLEDESGFFDTIGRWGTEPQELVDAAERSFDAEEFETSIRLSDSLSGVLDELEADGNRRFYGAVATLAGFLVLTVILLRRRTSRRRERQDAPR